MLKAAEKIIRTSLAHQRHAYSCCLPRFHWIPSDPKYLNHGLFSCLVSRWRFCRKTNHIQNQLCSPGHQTGQFPCCDLSMSDCTVYAFINIILLPHIFFCILHNFFLFSTPAWATAFYPTKNHCFFSLNDIFWEEILHKLMSKWKKNKLEMICCTYESNNRLYGVNVTFTFEKETLISAVVISGGLPVRLFRKKVLKVSAYISCV